MGEELRKRNTDCVYFLASPLTCKKGFDCEYRHSEIARLNPRDCFYWLAGNCLNAACGFRHPPMDAPSGMVFESTQCSVPVNKTNIPCYFYFNGFCSKGDTCSFLHGNYTKTIAATSTNTGFPRDRTFSSEDKTAAANRNGSASTDASINPSKNATGATVDMAFQCKEGLKQSFARNAGISSACAQISVSKCAELAVDEPVSLLPAEGSNDGRSHAVADHSFEEPMMNERENRSGSSPGFDVLVDCISENFEYDDPEYLVSTDKEQTELDSELCGNSFEDLIAYEPKYSDVEFLDEHEMHICNHLEGEPALFSDRKFIGCSRGKMLHSMFSQKRKLTLVNLDAEEWNHADFRNHLHRHKISGNHSIIGLSRRRNGLSSLTGRRFAKPRRHGSYHPSFGCRMASQVGKLTVNFTFSNGTSQCGSSRHSRPYKPSKHYDGNRLSRQQSPLSGMLRKPVSRDRRHYPKAASFKGPKTLSQIKEEKRRAEENGSFLVEKGCSIRSSSADFKGPRPLSDILKDKKRAIVKEIST